MHREHVDLIGAHKPLDNAVRWEHNFPYRPHFEFWNDSTGFRKRDQSIGGSNQPSAMITEA
jgi:hypothetical protein